MQMRLRLQMLQSLRPLEGQPPHTQQQTGSKCGLRRPTQPSLSALSGMLMPSRRNLSTWARSAPCSLNTMKF